MSAVRQQAAERVGQLADSVDAVKHSAGTQVTVPRRQLWPISILLSLSAEMIDSSVSSIHIGK